jgi:hypothetical protein
MATQISEAGHIVKIDLGKYGGPVFVGREAGELARKRSHLDKYDGVPGRVKILVPEGTYSVNSSFFLGMFDKSIKKLGSREAFLEKFEFEYPKHLAESIEAAINRALLEKKVLLQKS